MKTYLVGGAVRDLMLGREPHDRDYVVVGATPSDMLAMGFEQVGADFPVFLHPETRDEFALARVERKVGPGYRGFEVSSDPTISIEDDLIRRDLTINSMAHEVNSSYQLIGELIDPYDGCSDLRNGILRHTSKAFEDDPLRVLRLARFAARLPGFKIHADTLKLVKRMIDTHRLKELTQERVYAEVRKALQGSRPIEFFATLSRFGALDTALVPSLSMFDSKFISLRLLDDVLQHLADVGIDIALGVILSSSVIPKHAMRGLSQVTFKVADTLSVSWKDFTSDCTYQRLLPALRGGWGLIEDSLLASGQAELIPLNFALLQAMSKVKAEAFPHLEGKALGDALKQARIEAIDAVIAQQSKDSND